MNLLQERASETVDLIHSKKLLMRYGIPVNDSQLTTSLADAARFAAQLGWPLVLKIASPDISHKSDVGGVKANIRSEIELRGSYSEMLSTVKTRAPTARITGVTIEKMVEGNLEIIMGMKRDPIFGRVFLFGMGGIYTEILRDISFRVEPVNREDIHGMIREIKQYKLLAGARGRAAVDLEAIVDVMMNLQQLVVDDPQIREVDLNPIILSQKGPIVVDARIVRDGAAELVDRGRADQTDLSPMLDPVSVAIVGASKDLVKPGGKTVQNLVKRGFARDIYPINLREAEIQGKKCFRSFKEISGPVDLAVISVPADSTTQVIQEGVQKGVEAFVIVSSGFAEAGPEGRKLQESIVTIARSGGARICGPNCEGLVVPKINMYATFASSLPPILLQGDVALVTQSGSMGEAMLSYFSERDLGVRSWISCGNEADLEMSDYVEWLSDDPTTRIICLLMEGVRDGVALKRALAKAAHARKPVLVMKLGRSDVGATVAKSHTGTLVGSNEVYDAVFEKYGVLRVSDIEELIDSAMGIDWQPLPHGRRVGVVSGSGAQNEMIADACAENGLELPKFSVDTQKKLDGLLKSRVSNPIDYFMPGVSISQEAVIARECARIMAEDEAIDCVIIANNCLGEHAEAFSKTISEAVHSINAQFGKPVYLLWTMAGVVSLYDTVRIFYQNRVPVYPTTHRAIRTIKAATIYSDLLTRRS